MYISNKKTYVDLVVIITWHNTYMSTGNVTEKCPLGTFTIHRH